MFFGFVCIVLFCFSFFGGGGGAMGRGVMWPLAGRYLSQGAGLGPTLWLPT